MSTTPAIVCAGLEKIAQSIARGHAAWHDPVQIHRRVVKLFGERGAARYFRWELVPLSADEQAALPLPQRGCRRPAHRLVFHYDEAAAQADACGRPHYVYSSTIVFEIGVPVANMTPCPG